MTVSQICGGKKKTPTEKDGGWGGVGQSKFGINWKR